jgi:hypothetical protein
MIMRERALTLFGVPLLLAACERSVTAPDAALDEAHAAVIAEAASESRLVRSPWPSAQDPGPPFYARIEPAPPHLYTVDGMAVVAFYREPGCIRPDFNLLSFFDAPAAFGCSLAVEGFSIWQGAPFIGTPKVAETDGLGAVTFWFIPADAGLHAVEGGVLTIGELAALPGRLVGHATQFGEMLHPGLGPNGGGHEHPMFSLSARGTLEDGRAFEYHVTTANHALVAIRLRIG